MMPWVQGPRRLLLRYRPSRTRMGEVLAAVNAAGLSIVDLTTLEADLEDIFLSLIRGRRARGAEGETTRERAAAGPAAMGEG